MNCPHCSAEVLVAVEYDQVEVDYCPACRGIWLDAGELELLFGDAEAARRFLSIGAPTDIPRGEKPRQCPECDVAMTKESTASEPPVIFDHCPNGDGLWLDHGELETILEHAEALGDGAPVRTLLKDMFSGRE